jgi:hypothetical protein
MGWGNTMKSLLNFSFHEGNIDLIQALFSIQVVADDKVKFMAGIFTTISTILQTFFFTALSYFTDLAVKPIVSVRSTFTASAKPVEAYLPSPNLR